MAQTQKHDMKSTEKKKKLHPRELQGDRGTWGRRCTVGRGPGSARAPAAGSRPQCRAMGSLGPSGGTGPGSCLQQSPKNCLIHVDGHSPLLLSGAGAGMVPLTSSNSKGQQLDHLPQLLGTSRPPARWSRSRFVTRVQVVPELPSQRLSVSPPPFPGQTVSKGAACQAGTKAQGDALKQSCSTVSRMRHLRALWVSMAVQGQCAACQGGHRGHLLPFTCPTGGLSSEQPAAQPWLWDQASQTPGVRHVLSQGRRLLPGLPSKPDAPPHSWEHRQAEGLEGPELLPSPLHSQLPG